MKRIHSLYGIRDAVLRIPLFWPRNVPQLGVRVLASGYNARIIQPGHACDLALWVGVPDDAVLVRGLN